MGNRQKIVFTNPYKIYSVQCKIDDFGDTTHILVVPLSLDI